MSELTLTSIEGIGIVGADDQGELVWEWTDAKKRATGLDIDSQGHLYLAFFTEILELNNRGKILWSYSHPKFSDLHSLQVLPNGNILVASTSAGRALEVNKEKGIVWEWWVGNYLRPPKPPKSYISPPDQRFKNEQVWQHMNFAWRAGEDTLINAVGVNSVGGYEGNLLRVSKQGDILWEIPMKSSELSGVHYWLPYHDNYLVTNTHGSVIVEVNKKGESLRRIKSEGMSQPRGLRILKNDNLLVTNKQALTGKNIDTDRPPIAAEIDQSGRVVWRHDLPIEYWKRPNCAPFASIRIEDGTGWLER